MHELAIMESVVEAIVAHVGGARTTSVCLEVGALSGVAPDALRFCFDVCARGTPLEGASLELVEIGGRARCRTCGAEGAVEPPVSPCACGSFDRDVIAGRELRIKHVEIADVS